MQYNAENVYCLVLETILLLNIVYINQIKRILILKEKFKNLKS